MSDQPERRARKRRLRERVRLPLVSGRTSVIVLVCCLVLSALIVLPLTGRFPIWVNAEIVLGSWWVVWTVVLAMLLHAGHKLSDDHEWRAPRSWFGGKGGEVVEGGDGCLSLGELGGIDLGEGCVWGLVVMLALVLLFILAWVVVEVAIPAVAFVIYLLLRGMLARVVNDQHGCERSWPKALYWAAVWATVYIVPQAFVIWGAHVIAEKAR